MYCYKQIADDGSLVALEQRETTIVNIPNNMVQITEEEYNETLEQIATDDPEPGEDSYTDAITALETLGYTEG